VASTANIRNTDHFLFDHQNGRVFEITDGRIGRGILSRLVSTKNGFAIIGEIRLNIVHLNEGGRFVDSENLTSYVGGGEQMKVVQIASYGPGKALCTYFFDDFSQLGLAEIDLEKKTFQPIHARKSIEGYSQAYWAWLGGTFYFVIPETGEIHLLSNHFQFEKAIRVKDDPVKVPFVSSGNKGMPRFTPRLSNVVFTDSLIKFDLNDYRKDSSVESIRVGILKGGAFHVPPSMEYVVAQTEGVALIFNKDTGDYQVRRD